ncbi:MAG: hypothetical protein ABI813_15965 [Bacteroidota bacterium]
MELDELKTRVKAKLEEGMLRHSATDLELSIRQKTNSITGKIKKNTWLEFAAFIFCMGVALACWLLYHSLLVHLFCLATWVFCIVFSAYLFSLYKKIIFYEKAQASVKENLQQVINILNRFTTLYFRITMVLLPVIFVFGLITGYVDVSQKGLIHQFHWSGNILFYIIIFMIGWSGIIYFFAKWYIRKLYGDYLIQLKHQLKEIENG